MPEMNGVDAMIAIRGEFPEARIIVLTTYTGDVQVLRALKAGARAFLLKNSLHKELLEAIRIAGLCREKGHSSTEASMQLAEHATDDALTPAEIRVLAADCGQGMPIKRLPRSFRSAKRRSRAKSETSFPNWAPTTVPTPP